MKLRLVIKEAIIKFLFEGKIEDFVTQNPNFEPYLSVLKEIPSPAYLPWVKKNIQDVQQLKNVIEILNVFYRNKSKMKKKDLYQYKNIEELMNAIEQLSSNSQQTCQAVAQQLGDTELIYEDDEYCVVYPKTQKSSCYWGKNTEWCTAYTNSQNQFSFYSGKLGIHLYHIIKKGGNPRTNPNDKINLSYSNDKVNGLSLLTQPGATVNSRNQNLTKEDVITILGAKSQNIINSIENDAAKRGETDLSVAYKNATPEMVEQQYQRMIEEKTNPYQIQRTMEIFIEKSDSEEVKVLASQKIIELARMSGSFSAINDLAENPKTPLEIIMQLMKFSPSHAAKNPSLPIEMMEDIVNGKNSDAKLSIIYNKNLPESLFIKLSLDNSERIREQVAISNRTPLSILERMAKNPNESDNVKQAILENENVTEEIIEFLSNTKNRRILQSIANNSKTPEHILANLSKINDSNLKIIIASNPNTPINVLTRLSKNKNQNISDRALRNLQNR